MYPIQTTSRMFTPYSNNLIYANIDNDISIGTRLNPTSLPLWSSRRMFNDEYLQAEVTKELPLEKSKDDILNMNTYKCHICDTKVPKLYMRAHNEGERHKLSLKIADIALERARNQLKLYLKEQPVLVQVTGTYFCEPCSVITEDKILHDNTESHRKCLNYINLLKDFSIVYEDKEAWTTLYDQYDNVETIKEAFGLHADFEEKDNDEIDLKKSNNSDVSKERKKSETNIKCIDLNESDQNESDSESDGSDNTATNETSAPSKSFESNFTKSDNNETQVEKESQIELKKPDTKEKICKEQNESQTSKLALGLIDKFDQILNNSEEQEQRTNLPKVVKKEQSQVANSELAIYLKTVTEKYSDMSTHSVEALTDKLILVTAVNGDKIKVSVNNFHSIHAQKVRSYCKVCVEPNIGKWHTHGEEHMDKIMVPIEDQNGIRKVDDVLSHCIICNDVTKNINIHVQSLRHRNKLKQALVPAKDMNQNIIQKLNENAKLIQEHSLVVSHNRSEISCNICSVTIPNHHLSIQDHINTIDHITTYNETIEHNKLNEMDDADFYCVPCDMLVDKCYALGHCNGKKHNKNLAVMLKKENEYTQVILPSISQQVTRCKPKSAKTDSDLICFVCNTVLYKLNSHMNSLEHNKNYFSYLEANKLNEIEEDKFFCIPCNTVILIDYLMGHCNARKHKIHVKNFKGSASVDSQKSSSQELADNSHISRSIQEKQAISTKQRHTLSQNGVFNSVIPLKYSFQFTEVNSSNLLCTICDEEVPYQKNNVQNHVNQTEHIVSFNLMMLWNKIKRRNGKYFCDYCKVDIAYFNELNHVTSSFHVKVVAKETKWTVYEYNKKLLTLEFAMSHKIGDRVKPRSLVVSKPKG